VNIIYCIPIYLYPVQRVSISRLSILPGVKLTRLNGELKEKISAVSKNLPREQGFSPNYVILIDEALYKDELLRRIVADGSSPPVKILIEPNSIAKQVVFSLILSGRISFKFRDVFTFKIKLHGKKKVYSIGGYSYASQLQEISPSMELALLQGSGKATHLKPKKTIIYALKLDRYYRSGLWWNDRFSMALAYIWDALCSSAPQQSFMGLTNALEALISTTTQEITHILAERIALITEKTPKKRKIKYNQVKDLYKTRSKIVHGSVFMKKGIQTTESLVISPRFSNVPLSMMTEITEVTFSLIIAVLANPNFLDLIQVKRNEQKINEDLNNYFTDSLFGL